MKASFKADEAGLGALWKASGAAETDLLLMIADKEIKALKALGEIRHDFVLERAEGRRDFKFAWVTDFPLFEWSEEEAPVRLRPSSLHVAARGGRRIPGVRPGPGPGQGLRHRPQRLRDRRRLHPDPRPGPPGPHLQGHRPRRGGGPGQVRVLPRSAELRDAAPRRDRLRVRPAGHAPRRRGLPSARSSPSPRRRAPCASSPARRRRSTSASSTSWG